MRSKGFLTLVLWLAVVSTGLPGEPPTEPPAPGATPAVQASLDEGASLLEEKKADLALAAADRALAAATKASDTAGRAYAQRLRGRSFGALKQYSEAMDAWHEAKILWKTLGAGPESVEALCFQAVLLRRLGKDQDSLPLVAEAEVLAGKEALRPLAMVRLLNEAVDRVRRAGGLDEAKRLATQALTLAERRAAGSLYVASSLASLGNVAHDQNDLTSTKDYYERALRIREKVAPGSPDVADSLHNLGSLAEDDGNLPVARDYYERSLAIIEKEAPDSVDASYTLDRLGLVVQWQGDLLSAGNYFRRALAIREKLVPGSLLHAASLQSLGGLAAQRGDMVSAYEYFRQALTIQEKLAPGSLHVAGSLGNLGVMAAYQGDLVGARDYFQRALAIQEEKLAPGRDLAGSLNNLGVMARRQDDLQAAQEYFGRALEIQKKLNPGSLDVALSLSNLGVVARRRGDLPKAQEYFRNALAIQEQLAPGSLDLSYTLSNLGDAARDEGDLEAARDFHQLALEIREKLAPGSMEVAESFDNIGLIERDQRELRTAERSFARAWEIVRKYRQMVAGDESGQAFGAAYGEYSADLVQARVNLGRTLEAFQSLEEGRAQALVQLLSERGLSRAGIDPELWQHYEAAEMEFQRVGTDLAQAGAEVSRLEREMGRLQATESAESSLAEAKRQLTEAGKKREEALSAYTRARLEQERLLGEIRRRVPGLVARSFSLAQARKALPRGSVFLAYSLGDKSGTVFAIPSDPKREVEAIALPLGKEQLSERVEALRRGIMTRQPVRATEARVVAPGSQASLITASRSLFKVLFPTKLRRAIEGADRLIVSPDGPLWELPFAALVSNDSPEPRWLGLEKKLSYSPSMTVWSQEREAAPSVAVDSDILVVGDPLFARQSQVARRASGTREAGEGAEQGAKDLESSAQAMSVAEDSATGPSEETQGEPTVFGERSTLVTGGVPPPRLPASGVEAREVAKLYGTQALLGEEATEAAVRQRISNASVVHLATHGYFHPYLAMSSGLLLTPPPKDPGIGETENDGALQAWEFGKMLPLKAELVVLSACETGRGEKVEGEGLIGLTRALEGAGARSVVATLWKVSDASTVSLMVSFHERLREGLPKDEALRQAMSATAAKTATSHPYYWAGFFLTGDPDRALTVGRSLAMEKRQP